MFQRVLINELLEQSMKPDAIRDIKYMVSNASCSSLLLQASGFLISNLFNSKVHSGNPAEIKVAYYYRNTTVVLYFKKTSSPL